MGTYKYESFSLDRPSFRLLRLLKGEGTNNVKCELFQAYLDSNDLIPYHAVSYTWGGTELSASVMVNGKTHGVTENLYLALQYLRRRETDRVLWVDAICINQGDQKERGHQVQQMGSIYSQAEEVVIWLGPATFETKVFMDSLTKLKEKSLGKNCKSWDLGDPRWGDLWQSVQTANATTLQREGFKKLLSQPWFKRVWILQEVANAQRAVICSGERSVPAHIFVLAPSLLDIELERHPQAVLDIMPGPGRKSSWWSKRRDLYTLLRRFSDSKASDPRDLVYAVLGISSDAFDADSLRPDYTKTYQQVIHSTGEFLFGPTAKNHTTIEKLLQDPSKQDMLSFSQIIRTCTAARVSDYFKHQKEQVEVTEAVVEAAAANEEDGKGVLKLLMQKRGAEVKITEAVVQAAAANEEDGKGVLKLLMQKRGAEVKITEAVVQAAAANSKKVLELLLRERGAEVKITEAVVQAAAANSKEVLELLLRERGAEVKITEAVVQAAAANSKEVLELLLRERGAEVKITEAVVLAAAANSKEVLKLLLQKR